MKTRFVTCLLVLLTISLTSDAQQRRREILRFDSWYFETANGRTQLPTIFMPEIPTLGDFSPWTNRYIMPDGRTVTLAVKRNGKNYDVSVKAKPDSDILKWGFAVAAAKNEYFTGLMERVVDGPQRASWGAGRVVQLVDLSLRTRLTGLACLGERQTHSASLFTRRLALA